MNEVETTEQIRNPKLQGSIKKIEKRRLKKDNLALKKMVLITIICLLFMIVELIGGILSNSLAIITDAAHLFSDMSGFLISIVAICIGEKPSNKIYTFGYHRAEVLGALSSVLTIWVLTAFLVKEAIERLYNPSPIDATIMLYTSIFGLFCNLVMIKILHSDELSGHHNCNHNHGNSIPHENSSHRDHSQCNQYNKDNNIKHDTIKKDNLKQEISITFNSYADYHKEEENVNVSAAVIHIIGDIIQSVGVVIAASIIYYNPKWIIADPICTFIFAIIVFITTINVTKKCIAILMEATPEKYKIESIENYLRNKYSDIINIHDFHVWAMSTDQYWASLHIVSFNKNLLGKVQETLKKKYNIANSTIQIESPEENEKLLNCYVIGSVHAHNNHTDNIDNAHSNHEGHSHNNFHTHNDGKTHIDGKTHNDCHTHNDVHNYHDVHNHN